MKKVLLSVMATLTLALGANNATTISPKVATSTPAQAVADPFEQMEKIFQMQLKQMEQMQKQMDAMFKAFESQQAQIALPAITSSGGVISSGIVDKGDYYEVTLKANKDAKLNIKVEAKNGMLSIRVDEKKEINKKTPFGEVKSYSTSTYMQSFTLPADADEKNIKYEAKDGQIVVKIPKKK